MSATIACEHCGLENRVGTLVCRQCNRVINKGLRLTKDTTIKLGSGTLMMKTIMEDVGTGSGTGTLPAGSIIRLHIHGFDTNLFRQLRSGTLILGRADASRNIKPEVDLNPFEAVQNGVSRCHALLRREGNRLILQDLGSANGTYLNGERLLPYKLHRLHDGDTVRLGKLVLQVYF